MPIRAPLIITSAMQGGLTRMEYMELWGYDDSDPENIIEAFKGRVSCSTCGTVSSVIALDETDQQHPACGYWIYWGDL
jgi:hypothetical protein